MMPWHSACRALELPSEHPESAVQPAFRKAARRWHPDSSGTRDTEAAFAIACEAKDRLTLHRHVRDDEHVTAYDVEADSPDTRRVVIDLWDIFARRLSRKQYAQGFYRRDRLGVATVWVVSVRWSGLSSRYQQVHRFQFSSDREPPVYTFLVSLLGRPTQHAPWKRRARRPSSVHRS